MSAVAAASRLKPTASFVKQSNGQYIVSLRCRLGDAQHELSIADAIARGTESANGTRVLLKFDDGCEASVLRDDLQSRHKPSAEAFVVDTAPDADAAVVLPGQLYVGSQDAASNRATLLLNGIVNVLNVGPAIVAAADSDDGVRRLHVPLLDVPETQLPTGDAFAPMRQFIESGATLVHCNAGVSRSVSICILYLLETGRCSSVDEALALIRTTRPAARPNDGFLRQLKQLQQQILKEKEQLLKSCQSGTTAADLVDTAHSLQADRRSADLDHAEHSN